MLCTRLIRALAALSLAASLLLIPAAANAAPRTDRSTDDGSPTLLVRLWEWLSRTWDGGTGGPGVDPSGVLPPQAGPEPAAAPVRAVPPPARTSTTRER